MRNLSFALTTAQMRDRSKTVTRRRGTFWLDALQVGELVQAVEKSQGIRKGGIVRLGVIRIVSAMAAPLSALTDDLDYGFAETTAEGFPDGHPSHFPSEFVRMFCAHMGGDPGQLVTRIEFEHVCVPACEPRENLHARPCPAAAL